MFRNKTQNELCILHELEWNPKVWINIILNVKNQAQWVVHFIKDVSRVMKETGDQNINVIIVDYGNKGLDIGQEMKRWVLSIKSSRNVRGLLFWTFAAAGMIRKMESGSRRTLKVTLLFTCKNLPEGCAH